MESYRESHHSFVSFFGAFFKNTKKQKNEFQIFFCFFEWNWRACCFVVSFNRNDEWQPFTARPSVRPFRPVVGTQHGPFDILSIRFTLFLFPFFPHGDDDESAAAEPIHPSIHLLLQGVENPREFSVFLYFIFSRNKQQHLDPGKYLGYNKSALLGERKKYFIFRLGTCLDFVPFQN